MPKCMRCKAEIDGVLLNGHRYGCLCDKCEKEEDSMKAQQGILDRITCRVSSGLLSQAIFNAGYDKCAKKGEEWPQIRQWINGTDRSIYIHGRNGVGKTFAARCVLVECLSRPQIVTCSEVTAMKLVQLWRAFGDRTGIQNVMRQSVILIDDIDKVDATQNANMLALFDAVNYAYERGSRFLVTSNLDKEKLTRLFRQSCAFNESTCIGLLDRLNPCADYFMQGQSRRRKGNND